MAAAHPASLLERRLVVVTGKGGTGKTTVSAALALGAVRAGRRVLLAEMGPDEQIPSLLRPGAPTVGYAGRELRPGLHVMRIEPFAALSEYLGLQLRVQGVVDLVVRNRAFQQLMGAAPGWRELITLGKIWHLAEMSAAAGRPRFDLIVVDAPATGHGVTFLDVPRVVVSAVRAGPLRDQTERVEALLEDPARTTVLPVTLAEELPAKETAELVARVRDDLGLPVDRVVVNALAEAPFPPVVPRRPGLDEVLSRLPADLDLGRLPPPATLAACAHTLLARHALNERYTEEIRSGSGLPIVRLPRIAHAMAIEDLEQLADALLAEPTS